MAMILTDCLVVSGVCGPLCSVRSLRGVWLCSVLLPCVTAHVTAYLESVAGAGESAEGEVAQGGHEDGLELPGLGQNRADKFTLKHTYSFWL